MEMLTQITNEVATGLIAYEMKSNIKKEFDQELKRVKGLVNETYTAFLLPLVNELNQALMSVLKAEK